MRYMFLAAEKVIQNDQLDVYYNWVAAKHV